MANDFNKVMLVGRLTANPEIKQVGSSMLAVFTIANGRTYVSSNEKKEETNFIECEAWGKLAEVFEKYTEKGKQVLISGRLKQSTWETPDGKKASKIKVQVEDMQMFGTKGTSEDKGEPSGKTHEPMIDPHGVEDIF
jgi:single-strand DNA-binding protein